MLANKYRPKSNAALALADGAVYRGMAFGADTGQPGRSRFHDHHDWLPEVCTDPSFKGQIVCMTYPLIGNYGVADGDDESRQPWIAGLVVREHCDAPSNWRNAGTIDDYLKRAAYRASAGSTPGH